MKDSESQAIQPPPIGSTNYTGPVDVVVTGCLGFNPTERRLYLLDNEAGAYLLEEWREGLSNSFQLSPHTPLVAIAADEQQITGWPACLRSFLSASRLF